MYIYILFVDTRLCETSPSMYACMHVYKYGMCVYVVFVFVFVYGEWSVCPPVGFVRRIPKKDRKFQSYTCTHTYTHMHIHATYTRACVSDTHKNMNTHAYIHTFMHT